MMLHLWIAKAGHVQVSQVEQALMRIGREDIIEHCIYGTPADDSITNGIVIKYLPFSESIDTVTHTF